jgi:hypothetical protein
MVIAAPAVPGEVFMFRPAAQVSPAAPPPDRPRRLLETLKRAAAILRRAGIPFALAGGGAAYARGAAPPEQDVDFVLLESDIGKAAAAMDAGGMQVENPPEDWLIKAYDGDQVIGLIFKLADRPVSAELLDRAEEIEVAASRMPVMGATDLVISWLQAFSEHQADFAATLTCVRALREQVDWDRLQAETADSPFAYAFLVLLARLGVVSVVGENGLRHSKRRALR